VISFFFQAEDGIRDRNVTGVQTCALPISQPEEETAEGVLVVPGVPLLGGNALLISGHLAQGADEVVIGFDFLRGRHPRKPGEGEIGRASCRERGERWRGGGTEREKKRAVA